MMFESLAQAYAADATTSGTSAATIKRPPSLRLFGVKALSPFAFDSLLRSVSREGITTCVGAETTNCPATRDVIEQILDRPRRR